MADDKLAGLKRALKTLEDERDRSDLESVCIHEYQDWDEETEPLGGPWSRLDSAIDFVLAEGTSLIEAIGTTTNNAKDGNS